MTDKTLAEQVISFSSDGYWMRHSKNGPTCGKAIPISAVVERVNYWKSLACGNTETNTRVIDEIKALEDK